MRSIQAAGNEQETINYRDARWNCCTGDAWFLHVDIMNGEPIRQPCQPLGARRGCLAVCKTRTGLGPVSRSQRGSHDVHAFIRLTEAIPKDKTRVMLRLPPEILRAPAANNHPRAKKSHTQPVPGGDHAIDRDKLSLAANQKATESCSYGGGKRSTPTETVWIAPPREEIAH